MPIYEFSCLECGELFEILLKAGEAMEEIKCPGCGAQAAQRVLSKVSHTMGSSSGSGAAVSTRSCASGSCGTITLPGHTR
ncbi:MAG: zinc ribbon domain-containing protein [bacterium]